MVHQSQDTSIDCKPALGGPISAIPPPPIYLPNIFLPTQYPPTYQISTYLPISTYLLNYHLPTYPPTNFKILTQFQFSVVYWTYKNIFLFLNFFILCEKKPSEGQI